MPLTRDNRLASYDEASCQTYYDYSSGLVPMPLGGEGSGDSVILVRVAKPTSMRKMVFALSRMGRPPVVPSAQPLSDNEVLLSARVSATWPSKMADANTNVYRVEGVYHFVHKIPLVPGVDPLPVGTGPYDPAPQSSYLIEPSTFGTEKPPAPAPRQNAALGENIIEG